MYYVDEVRQVGVLAYPDIMDHYIVEQTALPSAILPPTRFLYIFCSYLWSKAFGASSETSVRAVSCLFSILTLGLSAAWMWRLAGRAACLGVVAMMSCAPVEIHLSQHGMIDGFFAFWAVLALWTLWECLRAPQSAVWQLAYGFALALMVLTKENAFFVYLTLTGLLGLNHKLGFGVATRRLLLISVAGPLLGGVILLFLAGGVETLLHAYRLLVARAYTLDYAIKNGDGPWHRYLVDLLLTSPIVLLLAIGTVCRVRLRDKNALYLIAFVVLSYSLMCNVKYSMNLRYATIWDLPLCYLAFTQLAFWSQQSGRPGRWLLVGGVVVICAYGLRQYHLFFVEYRLHELVSSGLLRALKILK